MSSLFQAGAGVVGQFVRLGWYTGIGEVASRVAARQGHAPPARHPNRRTPDRSEVLGDILALIQRDGELVRRGAAAPGGEPAMGLSDHISRVRALLEDVPRAIERRRSGEVATARDAKSLQPAAGPSELPEYYTQDFHFQEGGYLTAESARLYDVQVETLFRGTALAMRRQALGPIADFMQGRDQRAVNLLDVACGTGRFLREVRRAWPAMRLSGLDLSRAYLAEADSHLHGLRQASWIEANAEAIPLADASQDIVTSIYLFHELPPDVRRIVAGEMARVLKPGGLFVFIDSLQLRDRDEGWDGFLHGFPERFHEPYYRQYLIDDLDRVFSNAGLEPQASWPAFLSKVMVRRKPA